MVGLKSVTVVGVPASRPERRLGVLGLDIRGSLLSNDLFHCSFLVLLRTKTFLAVLLAVVAQPHREVVEQQQQLDFASARSRIITLWRLAISNMTVQLGRTTFLINDHTLLMTTTYLSLFFRPLSLSSVERVPPDDRFNQHQLSSTLRRRWNTHASFSIPKTALASIRCSTVVFVVLSCNTQTKFTSAVLQQYSISIATHLIRVQLPNHPHIPNLHLLLRNQLRHTRLLHPQPLPQHQIQTPQQSPQVILLPA